MEAFKNSDMVIAHISDLHFRLNIPGPPSIPQRRGRELIHILPQLKDKIIKANAHVLVVTGDIVDVPRWMIKDWTFYDWDREYWEKVVTDDYKLLKSFFESFSIPVLYVPGNHDHPILFKKIFGNQSSETKINGFTFFSFWDWNHRGSIPRRFDKQRSLFDRAMEDSSNPQIHLQHYIIEPEIESKYPYNYLEREELSRRLLKNPLAKLVLSGHFHEGANSVFGRENGGNLKYFTAKSFCEENFPLYIHSFDNSNFNTSEIELLSKKEQSKEKCIFLDRDGVLTEDGAYYSGPNELDLIENCGSTLKSLREKGFRLVVITNQTSIGLGYTSKDIVRQTHDVLSKEIFEQEGWLDGFYFGEGAGDKAVLPEFNHRHNCKPSPNLILKAAEELRLDLSESYMVGDRLVDIQAARAAGVQPILVKTGMGMETLINNRHLPDVPIFDNLETFAQSL